jgi:type III secretion protein C
MNDLQFQAKWILPLRSARRIMAGLVAFSVAMTAQVAFAGAPPFPAKQIEIVGRGQSVDMFLIDLFGQAGLKVKVSTAVSDKIQGTFRGSPAELWHSISKAFNLVAYYDGSVVRIFAASEIQSRTLSTSNPAGVAAEARQLGLTDANNKVTAGSSTVIASGVPYFLGKIEEISGRVAPKPSPAVVTAPIIKAPPVRTASLPATTDVISPSAGKPIAAPAQTASTPGAAAQVGWQPRQAPLRMEVRSQASARYPYEIRVYRLTYARAQDTVVRTRDREERIPGVVTILRGMLGDGRGSQTDMAGMNRDRNESGDRYFARLRYDDEQPESGSDPQTRSSNAPSGAGDINGPRIESDVSSNAVIIRDRPEAMASYDGLIQALDIEPVQIEIEATIIELSATRAKEFGVDLGLQTGGLSALFGGSLQTSTSAPSGQFSGSLLTGSGSLFTARITALEQRGTLRIVSKPRMVAFNNRESVFSNQTEIPLQVTSERVAEVRNYRGGLYFQVTPQISYDKASNELRTTMAIYIQDGTITQNEAGVPIVQSAELRTDAIVKQGESLLIGGMTVTSQFEVKSKTPLLGDVPVVGEAFKKNKRRGERIERLFLITPRIITLNGGPNAQPTPASNVIPLDVLRGKKPVKKNSI